MRTYTRGFTLESTQDVTKNDIIKLCKLLNIEESYEKVCTFVPEPVSEGGIQFIFPNKDWYKSVRLGFGKDKWPWVDATSMTIWVGDNTVILPKNNKITLFLKSFYGAPLFTIEELEIWENCLCELGLIRISKYPESKDLRAI